MLTFPLNPVKATQATAFLLKLNGGRLNYTKTIKLLYLADRTSLTQRDVPIVGGTYVLMKLGPVLSEVLNFINNELENPTWNKSISKSNWDIVLTNSEIQTDELSKSEKAILTAINEQFKNHSYDKVIDYCHDELPETPRIQGGMLSINNEQLLHNLGKKDEEIKEIEEKISFHSDIKKAYGF